MWTVSADDIRTFRKQQGWSQAELAERLGAASKRGVEDWEAGRRQAPPMLWLALNFLHARQEFAKQLALMQAGTVRVRHDNVDVTDTEIVRLTNQIAEYDRLLGDNAGRWND